MFRVYQSDLPGGPFEPLAPPSGALMADPAEFQIEWEINAHMAGLTGSVSPVLARQQWQALRDALTGLGIGVQVVPAATGLCDLVFTANQSFPARDGSGRVWLSRMRAAQRAPEVAVVAEAWTKVGRQPQPLPGCAVFEAGGDALWCPGRRVVLCGYGFRTDRKSLDDLATALRAPVVAFELVDDRFYHLDTCLCPLDERCALYVKEAFRPADVLRIHTLFPEAQAIELDEAAHRFSCNGASVRGHFLVQRGATQAIAIARARGLTVIELDTSEFLKSGGSVTCLHMVF